MTSRNQTSSDPHREPPEPPLIVVGVGASAGGLEALQDMVANLPADLGMSFIVAQHLSPTYKSMMVDLLIRNASMPVKAADDGEVLQANCIYICPPNCNIELYPGDVLRLTTYTEIRHTPRPSVDMLFESLAMEKGENAIAIVLSGTGSDGARGMRAVKAENGLSIVQDPETAKYNGMPNAAMNSGNVDLVVAPEQIGSELEQFKVFPGARSSDNLWQIPRTIYNGIIRLLKEQCSVDFGLYKDKTLLRRIERRMATLKFSNPEDYLNLLATNPEEVNFLFNDMLIGVTHFFRDARPFEQLISELTHYIKQKKDKNLRIWSVGCSTGEEAYTLAMIVSDILGDQISQYKVQIFATDIDKHAIDFARNGVYPEAAIQNLPATMKQRYLAVKGDQFQVIKPVKAMVIFSIHDVNRDPPFLRLDLISCRNLMIYFTVELQRQLLPTFHYALNPKGLLMLGQSESIGVFQEQYRPLAKSSKIYESVFVGKKLPPERAGNQRAYAETFEMVEQVPAAQAGSGRLSDQYSQVIVERLKQLVFSNAILLNENLDIIFTEGKNPLLVRPEGVPTNNIFRNLHPQLSVDLRSALHALEGGKEIADTGFQNILVEGKEAWAKLILMSVSRDEPLGSLTLLFSQIEDPINIPLAQMSGDDSNEAMLHEQERLLAKTKEQLQDVIEELETSNEEMQSMNEELQSSNEELQSSNEELETTNEELQSTNEELQTAYSELRAAYEEKEQHQTDLIKLRNELEQSKNLLEEAERIGSTGSWMWDIPSRALTWSKGCYRIFGLDDAVFHPSFEAFIGLAHPEDRNRLEQHLKDLLINQARQPFVFKTPDSDAGARMVSLEAVVSFNDLKQAVKVMGSMTDITERVLFERDSTASKDKINFILNSSMNAACIYDLTDNGLEYLNPRFTNLLGYELDDIGPGEGDFVKLCHPDDRKSLLALLARLQKSVAGESYPQSYRLHQKDGDYLKIHANHTIYEVNALTGQAAKVLVTFFAAETMEPA